MTPPAGDRQPAPPPVFLERQSYRRRRLLDAARLMPLIGAGLFAVPLLWSRGGAETPATPTSAAILYIFSIWAGLIVVNAVFGQLTRTGGRSRPTDEAGPG